ncbi:hypothetical protein [Caryophanon tenue]|uniref:Uncharacterized protein n=1 Tax=Caryophanon tenue TaxID=33978 RepID=A0A1C0Y578_9BACL|nr:hypothetical protein [Caryophanon tenue]OCS82284.1 hypothetical protein A6M13_07570 [Caryophanon tenue]
MQLNRTESIISRDERIKLNENWDTLESEVNNLSSDLHQTNEQIESVHSLATTALDTAKNATHLANNIDSKATEALNKSNIAQGKATQAELDAVMATVTANATAQQLETLIVESGTSDAEVIAMRTDTITGETFNTGGERLDFISKSVNDIAVGAVNLLDGGGLSVLPTWLRSANGQLTVSEGVARYEIVADGASATRVEILIPSGVLKEKEYTLSFAYRSNVNLDIRGFVNAQLLYSDTMQVTSEWKVGYFIFKSLDATASSTLRIYTSSYLKGSFIEFDYFKLERGNRYTDFSPSTNDIVTTATTASSSKIAIANDFIRYGKIAPSRDFVGWRHTLPFELYRDSLGIIRHTFDIDSKINTIETKWYLSYLTGANTTADGSVNKPFRDINFLLEQAALQNMTELNVVLLDAINPQNMIPLTVDVSFLRKFALTTPHSFSWIGKSLLTSTAIQDVVAYKLDVDKVAAVVDLYHTDYRGMPTELERVSTKELCDQTENSYYTDDVSTWVNMRGGLIPNLRENIALIRSVAGNQFVSGNTELYIKNVGFLQRTSPTATAALTFLGNVNSKVFLDNVKVWGGTYNALQFDDLGAYYAFGCTATKAGYDGFNLHGRGGANPYEFGFEYDCHSYGNGTLKSGTNNAFTAHDGASILRVNSVGYDCYGPVCADVNGCDVLMYDCTMYDSTRPAANTKAAFYFDAASAQREGKAVLINCAGGGVDTYSINSDGNIPIFVKNFKGNNMNETLKLEILP